MNNRPLIHRRSAQIPIVLAVLSFTAPAHSADSQWVGADGDSFLDDAKWNPSGVPGASDVFLLTTVDDTQTVYLNGDVSVLSGLIEGTGSGSVTLNLSGGALAIAHDATVDYSGFLTVGDTGAGTIAHSNADGDAVIDITGPTYVGPQPGEPPDPWGGYLFIGRGDGASGSYAMTDLTAGTNQLKLNVQNEIQIGGSNVSAQSGGGFSCNGTCTGTFVQDGGSVIAGGVTIGINSGVGSYTINSGSLTSFLDLGNTSSGDNRFTQNGGTVTLSGMFIANGDGAQGTYTLNEGSLDSGAFAQIGLQGTGNFTQAGGTHDAGDLSLGAQPTGTGTYTLTGGTLNVGTAGTGFVTGTGGLLVGDAGSGTFDMTGGTLNILNDDIATATFVVGDKTGATGTFTQSGGAVHGGRALAIGLNGGTGTYNLNTDTVNGTTPTLDTGFIALGNNSGQGTFNQQTGTTNTTTSLFIGSQGTYHLDGGELETTGTDIGQGTIVGTSGAGALLSQTAGTHRANNLVVGNQSDGAATYDLSGGEVEVNGRIYLGLGQDSLPAAGSVNGLFKQSGGSVAAAQIFIGGFTEVIPDPIDPVNNPPTIISHLGNGRYELSGGVLGSTFTVVGDTANGSVLHTGGTFNAGELQLGGAGLFSTGTGTGVDPYVFYSSGTYDLQDDGKLNTTGTTVSVFGLGTFNQSGADSEHKVTGNLVVGSTPGLTEPNSNYPRQGLYTLSGGLLEVTGNTVIGAGNGVDTDPGFAGEPGALGTFTQSGGDHQVGGNLILGQSGNVNGGTGSYGLSAGSLSVTGETIIGGSGLPDGAQDGTGTFTQTGGTHTTGIMTVGLGQGSGTYRLSSTDPLNNPAVINSAITYLSSPNSVFVQDSGTHNTGFLNQYGGTYTLNGGEIDVGGNMGVGHPFGSATFTQTGGAVHVNDLTYGLYVGGAPLYGTSGEYQISGGSLDIAANAFIGSQGKGTVTQTGGAVTIDQQLLLGRDALGDGGTYTLSGGSLAAAGMGVKAGSSLDWSGGTLALGAGSGTLNNAGAVTLGGAGIRLVQANLDNSGQVGVAAGTTASFGAGATLNNRTGGSLIVNGTLSDQGTLANAGDIINAGHFNVKASARLQGSGNFTQTTGLLTADGVLTQSHFYLNGGTLEGTGTINGALVVAGALVGPGHSPGTLTVNGDFSFDSGTLEIEIGGLADFDRVAISGAASFTGGTILFSFINGFLPTIGDEWAFLDYGSLTAFNLVSFQYTGLGSGFSFSVVADNGSLLMRALNDGRTAVPEPGTWLLLGAGLIGWRWTRIAPARGQRAREDLREPLLGRPTTL